MLGRWLGELSDASLEGICTARLGPGEYQRADGTRCLVAAAGGTMTEKDGEPIWEHRLPERPHHFDVSERYDALVERFGPRANRALVRRAVRELAQPDRQAAA